MSEEPTAPKPPVFIVGCGRSGTTLLRLILDSHPHISCGPETVFLLHLKPLFRKVSNLKNYGFEDDYWRRKTADYFASFQTDYMKRRGKKRWADKTPRYALHLEFIRTLFPDCQIIHLIRDGRDVVASHRDRWGYRRGIKSVFRWRKYVTAARKNGRDFPENQYIEIRYEDLVSEPEKAMRRLLDFLEEPWVPDILNYMEAEHDMKTTHARLTGKRREEGNDKAVIYRSRIGAGGKSLDLFLKTLCHLVNGKLLRELGYIE